MSPNPPRFHQPIRLIVSFEAQAVDTIDAYVNAGGHHGHRNRSEFVRRAVDSRIRSEGESNGST
jgi:metal-responsive CopG/Arc/MetJ family transcriptional regulator